MATTNYSSPPPDHDQGPAGQACEFEEAPQHHVHLCSLLFEAEVRVTTGKELPQQGGGQVHAVVEALASPRLAIFG